MTSTTARSLRLGETEYPLVLPNIRDPRLHLASVIITIHVLGQVALGFRVSVPQILSAILTCFVIELVLTFRKTKQIVWPASAMLTGSGVALILRIVGQERGDHWTWAGWYYFAGIAAFSLLTKYLIRYRGNHVFNPSNVGLVVAFLILGEEIIEPLDFWWAPIGPWMAAAYLVILVGGLLITSRLRLLALAAAFWLTLTAGIGLLAASGHCMTTAWALQPVCGPSFWWVIVTSPEVLIFLFFMITDPKTIPQGRTARVVFGVAIALVSTLLMAPQTTEFGAKVGLLAGLVVLTPLRYVFDRVFEGARLSRWAGDMANRPARLFAPGALAGALLVMVPMGIFAAGTPARAGTPAIAIAVPEVDVDVGTLPPVIASEEVLSLNVEVDAEQMAIFLAEDLAIEGVAILSGDTSLLRAADDGERMLAMERVVQVAATTGRHVVPVHHFDAIALDVAFTDGSQGGASLALHATGTVERVTYDESGTETGRDTLPLDTTFVMSLGSGERWVIVSEGGGG